MQRKNQETPNENTFGIVLNSKSYENYRNLLNSYKNKKQLSGNERYEFGRYLDALTIFYPLEKNGVPSRKTLGGKRLEIIPKERFESFKRLVEDFRKQSQKDKIFINSSQ